MDKTTNYYFVYLTLAEVARHFMLPMLPLIYFDAHWLWSSPVTFADQAWALGLGFALVKSGGLVACALSYRLLPRFGPLWGAWCSHSSLVVVALFGLLAMMQHQVIWLQVGLFLHGALFCGEVSGLAFAKEHTKDADRQLKRLSYFQSYWCFGAMLGPLCAALFLSQSDWVWWLWWAMLLWGGVGMVWGWRHLPAKRHQVALQPIALRRLWSIMWPFCGLLWWVQLAWAMFYQFSPAFLTRYGALDRQEVAMSMAVLSVVLVVASGWLLPRLSNVLGLQAALRLGLGCLTFAGFLCMLPISYFELWLSSGVLMAVGDVILFVLLLRQLIQLSEHRGVEVICLVFCSCLLVWMMCGLVGGYGLAQHPLFLWYWVGTQSLLGIAWYRWQVRSIFSH